MGLFKSLLQQHSSKASILQHSAFFMVPLLHPYTITGNTIALNIQTFVSKVMSLLFNILSRFVIAFLPRSKHLLISWQQSPSPVIRYIIILFKYITYLCAHAWSLSHFQLILLPHGL